MPYLVYLVVAVARANERAKRSRRSPLLTMLTATQAASVYSFQLPFISSLCYKRILLSILGSLFYRLAVTAEKWRGLARRVLAA